MWIGVVLALLAQVTDGSGALRAAGPDGTVRSVASAVMVRRATGLTFSVLESYLRRRIISTDTPYGLKIRSVADGSPAARAGLASGDVLLSWDGRPIRTPRQLARLIHAAEPGTTVTVVSARLRADRSIWSRHPWEEREATMEMKEEGTEGQRD
jgi:membrane-associated protease RseP (regulator of RpoE activity)